jgi:hypothetical protein
MENIISKLKNNYIDYICALIILIIAISFSLCAFFHLLQFNLTSLVNKIIIFLSLFLFFLFALIEFCLPLLKAFLNGKWKYMMILAAIAITSITFLLLPYKFVPFRTTHTLTISVPATSSAVILEKAEDMEGEEIALTQFGIPKTWTLINIRPGKSYQFQDELTGNVVLTVHAADTPAALNVDWDGKTIKYTIAQNISPMTIATDASSWGKPTNAHIALAILSLIVDGISCISLLILLAQLVMGWLGRWADTSEVIRLEFNPLTFVVLLINLALISVTVFITNKYSSDDAVEIMKMSLFVWGLYFIRRLND